MLRLYNAESIDTMLSDDVKFIFMICKEYTEFSMIQRVGFFCNTNCCILLHKKYWKLLTFLIAVTYFCMFPHK